jgi:hypothetical protein
VIVWDGPISGTATNASEGTDTFYCIQRMVPAWGTDDSSAGTDDSSSQTDDSSSGTDGSSSSGTDDGWSENDESPAPTGMLPVYRFWSPIYQQHFYTISAAERDGIIRDNPSVWTYEGIAYYAFADDTQPGVVPVYRFRSSVQGSQFLTSSATEKAKLITGQSNGWIYEGIAYYAFVDETQPGVVPVYRFWSGAQGSHFYTTNAGEKAKLINGQSKAWVYEGIAFYCYNDAAAPSSEVPTQTAVYQFWSPVFKSYFYTANEAEKNRVVQNYPAAWTYEGIAYYAFADSTAPGVAPVYRFWSGSLGTHYYTTDAARKAELIQTQSNVWAYEGIAFYCYNDAAASAQTLPTRAAVYQLRSPSYQSYFYTASTTEKDRFLSLYPEIWVYEGIAWYACQP